MKMLAGGRLDEVAIGPGVAAEDRAPSRQVQVAPDVERVLLLLDHVVLDVVVDQARPVRQRPDVGDLPRDGIDAIGRDDVAGERLPRQRVEDRRC